MNWFEWMKTNVSTDDLEWMAALGAAVTVFVVFIRKVRSVMQRLTQFFRDFAAMPDAVKKLTKEIMPNDGSSLSDKIRAMETRLTIIDQSTNVMADVRPHPLFKTDDKGHPIFLNRAWLSLTGLSASDAQGDGWINAIWPEDRKHIYEEWEAAIEQERDFSHDLRMKRADGSPVWVSCTARVMKDVQGKVVGWYGVINMKDKNDA